jgi:hypothetical protein
MISKTILTKIYGILNFLLMNIHSFNLILKRFKVKLIFINIINKKYFQKNMSYESIDKIFFLS